MTKTGQTQMLQGYQDSQDLPGKLALLTRNEFPFFMPVPAKHDDLESIARKIHSLADVVASGRSLALATGQVAASRK